jgi:Gly-Xaa carboxypeptidase
MGKPSLFEPQRSSSRYSISAKSGISAVALILAVPFFLWANQGYPSWGKTVTLLTGSQMASDLCPQEAPLLPNNTSKALQEMDEFLKSDTFRNQSISRLSHAVKVETVSYDDMGTIGDDKRWDIFYDFASYLRSTFPVVHKSLELGVVNIHGLIYTWKGSDETLKPTLLMAHQDVVPVAESTISAWTHPPFSGFYDGKFIWGRGSSDCKNQLIAILEAIELLLAADFTPRRTVILSFGFDEEISGREGASQLAPHLVEKYGQDSMAVIVDEGAGVSTLWGSAFAVPGVGEKGYIDVDIIVRMPGGHSSIPPPHNGIGVMSHLLTLVENNPYDPCLDAQNPYLGLMQCGAAHGSEFPSKLKKLLPKSSDNSCPVTKKKDKLAIEAARAGAGIKYLFTTSLAIDVISGGAKVNALPERTVATVNHRINIGEDSSVVKSRLTKLANHIAETYNLTVHAFTEEEETPSSITLRTPHPPLEPAPVTPTSISTLSAYSILSGTTRALYGKSIIVAPGLMTGNTDTRYYWDLSRHIFRYVPGWDSEAEGMGNIHTVDEKISVKAHVYNVQWFSLFVRNMDEANMA